MPFCSQTSLGSWVYSTRKFSLGMITYYVGRKEGLWSAYQPEKGCVRKEKIKNVRQNRIEMSERRRRVKNWPKFTLSGQIFSWIKFCEQRLQSIFVWFSSDMRLSAGDLIWKILQYILNKQSRMLTCGCIY